MTDRRTCRPAVALAVTLAAALGPRLAGAQVVVTDDTYTSAALPTTNFGTGGSLSLGGTENRHAFVKFTLAALPAGTTGEDVEKATLKLWVNSVTVARRYPAR